MRDRGQHRAVAVEEGLKLAASLRGIRAPIVYAEASMQNGFGLKFIHRFLNVPFQNIIVRIPATMLTFH